MGSSNTNGGARGQRTNLSSASGQKKRSPTSKAHTGSRVDPSHAVEQARDSRAKAAAKKTPAKKR